MPGRRGPEHVRDLRQQRPDPGHAPARRAAPGRRPGARQRGRQPETGRPLRRQALPADRPQPGQIARGTGRDRSATPCGTHSPSRRPTTPREPGWCTASSRRRASSLKPGAIAGRAPSTRESSPAGATRPTASPSRCSSTRRRAGRCAKRTHDAYVRITDPATPPAERAQLRARQVAAAASATAPPSLHGDRATSAGAAMTGEVQYYVIVAGQGSRAASGLARRTYGEAGPVDESLQPGPELAARLGHRRMGVRRSGRRTCQDQRARGREPDRGVPGAMGQVELNMHVGRLSRCRSRPGRRDLRLVRGQLGGDIRGVRPDAGLLVAARRRARRARPALPGGRGRRRDRWLCLRRAMAPQAGVPVTRRKTRCSSHRAGRASASADGC